MRILVLAPHPFFQDRGTPIADRALLEVLSERGYEVEVLTFHEGEAVTIPNVTIHRIPRLPGIRNIRPGFSIKKIVCDAVMFFRCQGIVRRGKFDLVHAVEESVFTALVNKLLHRTPYVYDMDSSLAQQIVEKFPALGLLRRILEWFERSAVRRSLAVVTVCRALEEIVIGYDPGKPVRRVEDFSLLPESQGEAEDLHETIGAEGPIVLYVGNLEPYQGIDLLLNGFRMALATVPDAELVVIGGQRADRERYTGVSRRLGIGDHVHLLGPKPLSSLAGYLEQAAVVVSPRIKGQNTPMKVYSYLDSGRPVLATRLPTHTQVLDDEIALLVEPEPEAFGEGLVSLLRDDETRQMLVRMAKYRVQDEYSRQAFRRKMMSFYDLVERELEFSRKGRR